MGRPAAALPWEYASLVVFMVYFGLTYRQMESWSQILLDRRIDHSSIGRSVKRIPPEYVEEILRRVHNEVDAVVGDLLDMNDRDGTNHVPPLPAAQAGGDWDLEELLGVLGYDGVYIVDSTGIVTDRYREAHYGYGDESKERHHEWMKLHICAKYWRETGLISIASATVTGDRTGDSTPAPSLIRSAREGVVDDPSLLFSDSAYDAEAIYEAAYEMGLIPMIKLRDREYAPSPFRGKATEQFNTAAYRQFRSMIEGVFGGTETRYANRVRARLPQTRDVVIRLMAVAHDLRTLKLARTQAAIAS